MRMDRREFVGVTLGATAGMAQSITAASYQAKLDPMGSDIKLGLYSITFLGIWYRGEALTLEEMIKRAKKYGYAGIEIDGKRPHGNPLDMPKSRCRELRSMADGEGIEIYGVAANNDFSSPVPEHRECQILYTRELVRMASDLGAKTSRVFLAWPGITEENGVATYWSGGSPVGGFPPGLPGSTDLGLVPRRIDGMRAVCGRSRRHPGAAKP